MLINIEKFHLPSKKKNIQNQLIYPDHSAFCAGLQENLSKYWKELNKLLEKIRVSHIYP